MLLLNMLASIARIALRLAAYPALVRLFACMREFVRAQTGGVLEPSAAYRALVLPVICVRSLVVTPLVVSAEALGAEMGCACESAGIWEEM